MLVEKEHERTGWRSNKVADLKKLLKKFLHRAKCSWNYFNSFGERTELANLQWTNGKGLYRKCKECNKVQHLVRIVSQGDCFGAWWEDEEEVMEKMVSGEYYGTGKRLSELRGNINAVHKERTETAIR